MLNRVAELVRHHVPENLKPILRELNYRFGKDEDLSRLEAEAADLTTQWKEIVGRSIPFKGIDEKSQRPHILFVTGFGLGTGVWTQQPILMMSLYQRGCRVSSLFCDKALPACEFNPAGNHTPDAGIMNAGLSNDAKLATCQRCSKNVKEVFSLLPVELHPYHQFAADKDMQIAQKISTEVTFHEYRNFEYAGIKLGEEVFSSILRATFRGTVEDTALNRFLVKRYLLSGVLISHILERAFLILKPDRIMMPHGVYLTHGVANKIANKLHIPVIVYPGFGGIRKDSIMLSHKQTYHRTLVYEENKVWDTTELTSEQRQRTLAYALSKQSGGVDIVNYHPKPIESEEQILSTLGIDRSRAVIALYTNVIWDAQIYYDGNAFENILEWMFLSIEALGKNDKVWAVIRIHPAEVKGGLPTRQPFLQEIRNRFPKLPNNVRVIPPESDISSYTLAEQSKAVVIYGTKLGLELAIRGIPVIVCGETFCRGKGFTIDITSKQQYLEVLKDIQNLKRLDKPTIERALKYGHYLYYRRMIPFPYIKTEDVTNRKQVALSKLADLDAGKDPNLDAICSSIMNLTPPYARY
jgi:hypothetical protein